MECKSSFPYFSSVSLAICCSLPQWGVFSLNLKFLSILKDSTPFLAFVLDFFSATFESFVVERLEPPRVPISIKYLVIPLMYLIVVSSRMTERDQRVSVLYSPGALHFTPNALFSPRALPPFSDLISKSSFVIIST